MVGSTTEQQEDTLGVTRKRHSVVPVALIAVLTLLSMPPKASGAPEKAPAAAPDAAEEEFAPGRVIAKFRPDVPIQSRNAALAQLGLRIHKQHRTPGLLALEADASASTADLVRGLEQSGLVEYAEPDYILTIVV